MNLSDLSPIYSDAFQYSIPKETLQNFFDGKGFPESTPYTEEEKLLISADLQYSYASLTSNQPQKTSRAILSAGAPGAGKTLLLQRRLEDEKGKIPHLDPDEILRKGMPNTYGKVVKDSTQTKQAAYRKWRSAANAICHRILAELIRENYSFYYGTTASHPKTPILLNQLREKNYWIHIVHVIAPEEVRTQSISMRDGECVKITPEENEENSKLVPQRIHDFLFFADQIDFFYRGEVHKITHTATWLKETKKIVIHDHKEYDLMVRIHNQTCRTANLERIHLWESSVLGIN